MAEFFSGAWNDADTPFEVVGAYFQPGVDHRLATTAALEMLTPGAVRDVSSTRIPDETEPYCVVARVGDDVLYRGLSESLRVYMGAEAAPSIKDVGELSQERLKAYGKVFLLGIERVR